MTKKTMLAAAIAALGMVALVAYAQPPPEVLNYYMSMPNYMRECYAVFKHRHFKHETKTIKIKVIGQMPSGDTSVGMWVAYQMWNDRIHESEWKFISWWAVRNDDGTKIAGKAPVDFSVWKRCYGPPDIKSEVRP